MTIKKKHYFKPSIEKPILLECLNEKSLAVLRNLGHNIDELRNRKEAKNHLPVIINKIKKNFKNLDQKIIMELRTMCYISENPKNANLIVRPYSKKIIILKNYVNNNPAFR